MRSATMFRHRVRDILDGAVEASAYTREQTRDVLAALAADRAAETSLL